MQINFAYAVASWAPINSRSRTLRQYIATSLENLKSVMQRSVVLEGVRGITQPIAAHALPSQQHDHRQKLLRP